MKRKGSRFSDLELKRETGGKGGESWRQTGVLKGELSGGGNYQMFALGIGGISNETGRGEMRWNGKEPSATLN